MRRFPGIGFRGQDSGRRAWVIGTGLDVWQIAEGLDDFGDLDAMVAEADLTERQIRLAMAYRELYPAEIEDAIADNRRPIAELRELYPFIHVADHG